MFYIIDKFSMFFYRKQHIKNKLKGFWITPLQNIQVKTKYSLGVKTGKPNRVEKAKILGVAFPFPFKFIGDGFCMDCFLAFPKTIVDT